MKFVKFFSSASLALALLLITSQSAYGVTISLQTWDLVDSGKHLDWSGSTKYQSSYDAGIRVWIDYKMGIIRPDSIFVIEDVVISDYSKVDTYAALTHSTGKMEFNTYYMDGYTPAQKQNVCSHEMGHALGLEHNTTADIISKYVTSNISLSANDKASFDAAYNKY